jgi:glycosyltransferase involved in cell wall biosynthesis
LKEKRILILTPTAFPMVTGNAVTAERWRRGLEQKGRSVKVFATEGKTPLDLLREIHRFGPKVIHIHHAYRAAFLFLDPRVASCALPFPIVVSPAGTDIHLDLLAEEKREIVLRILGLARAIVVQNEAMGEAIREIRPDLMDRIHDVPKSILWFGSDPCDLRSIAGCQPGEVLFFLPAGIRPVKGNLEALRAMKAVHRRRPNLRVVFSGPILDEGYGASFQEELRENRAFARWIPQISPSAIRSAYASADLVLNTSMAEGFSNVLLEAMAAGRPILASDIPANRGPLLGPEGEDPAGWLYDLGDPRDFLEKAIRLVDEPKEREALGRAGRLRALQFPRVEDEAEGLIRAYERAARENL